MIIIKTYQLLFLCSILILLTFMVTGCQEKQILLNSAVENSKGTYQVPGVKWKCTRSELMDSLKLSNKDLNSLTEESEKYEVKERVVFENPEVTAKIVYIFEDDLFVGKDIIIIEIEDKEKFLTICQEISIQAEETLPKPDSNSFEKFQAGETGISWFGEDKSSFSISLPKVTEGDSNMIILSTRGPRN